MWALPSFIIAAPWGHMYHGCNGRKYSRKKDLPGSAGKRAGRLFILMQLADCHDARGLAHCTVIQAALTPQLSVQRAAGPLSCTIINL